MDSHSPRVLFLPRRGECGDGGEEEMAIQCGKSCAQRLAISVAMGPDVADQSSECEGWARAGECSSNPMAMLAYCAQTCTSTAAKISLGDGRDDL